MSKSKKNIVWIASYPKSGNTWFRTVLSNLLSDSTEPLSINQLTSSPIASSRVFFDDIVGTSSSDLTYEEIEELRSEAYIKSSNEAEGVIFRKVHDSWKICSSGRALFPEEITKAVIYIVRNPLDIAVSFAFHSNKSFQKTIEQMNDSGMALCDDPRKLHNQLRQELTGWSDHVNSWVNLSGLPLIVLKYENLLEDAFSEFNRAFNFIGMKADPDRLAFAIESSNFERLAKEEVKEGFKERPIRMEKFFRSGKSGDWKKHLDKILVKDLIDRNYILMERFGYLTEI